MLTKAMNRAILQQLIKIANRRDCSYKSVRRPDMAKTWQRAAQPAGDPKAAAAAGSTLAKQLKAKIVTTGPITVAEYMREVLTNPLAGYYMNRDVFGREGDFTTSPEISQIFGELVGVWLLSEWYKLGSPAPFQFVELGPGRGTLARDILKVLAKFKLAGQFSMHFVEVSLHLSQMQAQRFCFSHEMVSDSSLPYYQVGQTGSGASAYWYKRIEDVPHEFSIVVAHEFFDALPVHKLQLDEDGLWKEILVDVADGSEQDFRFVLSKSQTPVSRLYQPIEGESRQSLEYSLETDCLVSSLAERFERDGGFGLIMDYGHYGEKTDTFRAFKSHKLHDPLKEPGTADLTADVDFRQIQHIAEKNGQVCYGPVEQGSFLKKMEGDARLEKLLENALPENKTAIKSGYQMLTDPNQMGKRFKFFSMFPAVLKEHLTKFPVNGFH